jgi:hypothetical protein
VQAMEYILLLVWKTFLFIFEVAFELWKREKEKAFNDLIIKRLESIENEVKGKLKP